MADSHANFSYSTVATAPSPALSGTSLVVQAATGALFPAAPFNVTIWPVGVQPTSTNAEIARVTLVSTDTFTITRATESSTNRAVIVGDQIAATITKKTLTDAELGTSTLWDAAGDIVYGTGADTASRLGIGTAGQVLRTNAGATAPAWMTSAATISTPGNPAGTSSATFVMMGLAGTITPTVTGRVLVVIRGDFTNDGAVGTATWFSVRAGTGAAPANGAATTGTTYGNDAAISTIVVNATESVTLVALLTGLTINTAYWIDVAIKTAAGGTGFNRPTIVAVEV